MLRPNLVTSLVAAGCLLTATAPSMGQTLRIAMITGGQLREVTCRPGRQVTGRQHEVLKGAGRVRYAVVLGVRREP